LDDTYTILYYSILYYTILYYSILYYIILHYTILILRREQKYFFMQRRSAVYIPNSLQRI